MKTTFILPALFTALLLSFFGCQKEPDFEIDLTARYSLDGGTSSCAGAVVSGTYTAGTAVTTSNKVVLNITVDSTGPYAIATGAVNGLSFSGYGVFTRTGAQTVTLLASGTPSVSGTYNFTPVANGCTFSVTVTDASTGGSGGTASYSFNGGTSSCTDATVSGTYTAGTAMSSANTVALKLTVNTTGSYNISTNTVNGISFSGSGNFNATGVQTITLTASGTPAAAGSFSFQPGANTCNFNVTVSPAAGGGSSGGSGNFLRCKIDGVLSNFNTSLVGYYVPPPGAGAPFSASVQGKYSDVPGSPIEMWVVVSNPTAPTTGVYSNRTISMAMDARASQISWYPTGFPNEYWSQSILTANTFTVNISSISSAGATGTFSGTMYDQGGLGTTTKQITEGEFKISF